MKARKLIDGAAFGPDAMRAIGQAFDEAWASIAHHFSEPLQIEVARLKLANAILSIAHEDSRDVEVLKRGGLEAMALRYRALMHWSGQLDASGRGAAGIEA